MRAPERAGRSSGENATGAEEEAIPPRPSAPAPAWLTGPVPVAALFAILGLTALTFEYVEGDDAGSLAHHAFGRIDAYPRLASRHAGADWLLGLLPADEAVLRVVAISASFVAGFAVVLLLSRLVAGWATGVPAAPLLIAVAIPELLFLSLVYQPALIAFALALTAHLLVRQGWSGSPRALVAGSILLGVAGAIRFDILPYGLLIALDARHHAPAGTSALRTTVRVGLLAAAGWVVSLLIVGDGPSVLADAWRIQQGSTDFDRGLRHLVATNAAVFTPAVVILLAIALVTAPRSTRRFLAEGVVVALLFAAFLGITNTKSVLFVVPLLALGVVEGAAWLTARGRSAQVLLALVLVVPWFVGLTITTSGTQWGPGFEVRDATDRRDGVSVGVVLADPTALPMPEGPRPTYGYASVLFGGDWRGHVRDRAEETEALVDLAFDRDLPILVAQGSDGFVAAELAERGLTPASPERTGAVVVQRFSGDAGSIEVWRVFGPAVLSDDEFVIAAQDARARAFATTGYASTMVVLVDDGSFAVEVLGPRSAVIQGPWAGTS